MAGTHRRRCLPVLGLAPVALIAGVLTAGDAQAGPAVDGQAWSRQGSFSSFLPEDNRIYVAVTGGSEEARAFVHLDRDGVMVADLAQATLVLTEATGTVLPEQAHVAACALAEPFTGSGELPPDEAPEVQCAVRADAQRDAETGQWTVSLAAFSTAWRQSADTALALVADVSALDVGTGAPLPVPVDGVDTWRLAFDTDATALASNLPTPTPTTEAPPAVPAPDASRDETEATSWPGVSASEARVPASPLRSGAADTGPAEPPGDQAAFAPGATVSAATPGALGVFGLLGLGLAVGLVALGVRRPASLTGLAPARWAGSTRAGGLVVGGVAAALLLTAPLLASNLTLFKVGLVLIVIIAAIGLHMLVNWAGELSLAHASFIGLPAFAVGKLSADHGISPLLLLPLAVAIGAMVGAVVGMPSLRTTGLQVAVVTLAAGMAIERFFFTKPWLIGRTGGVDVAPVTLGPLTLSSWRALYPVIVAALLLSLWAAWALYHSKVARALAWIRADPRAAAAFGIPVGAYKVLAYTLAGAFAGLAGGLTGVWVQRLAPQAFPFTLSFTYLVIVVLAGRGFIGGVIAAALLLEGGRQFSSGAVTLIAYGGPLALVVVLTRYRAGLNGIGREIVRRLRETALGEIVGDAETPKPAPGVALTPSLALGIVAIVAGFVAIGLAWYHAGNTDQVWIQNQELISGGVGGIALEILGVGLLLRDRIAKSYEALADRLTALAGGLPPGGEPDPAGVDDEEAVVGLRAGRHRATLEVASR